MEKTAEVVRAPEQRAGEKYHEPLLIKHEPLRDVTGTKYGEKGLIEKTALD